MTIHDILMSCGSVTADTLIYIGDINGGIKWVGKFKNISKENEYLKFRVFFLAVDSHFYPQRMILKFIIQFGADTMLNLLWVLGAIIDILRGVNNDDLSDQLKIGVLYNAL